MRRRLAFTSPDSVTIDLDKPAIDPPWSTGLKTSPTRSWPRIARCAWFPSDDELARLDLRKVPDVDGKFRVVVVEDFDANACGGTHVSRTGEIGLIRCCASTGAAIACGSSSAVGRGRCAITAKNTR